MTTSHTLALRRDRSESAYHRTHLLLPNGDPNPHTERKFRCRHYWPDGTACRFPVTQRRQKRERSSFWCDRHAPEGAVPLRVEDLADAARAEYLVGLAEDRPWTAETLARLRQAVHDLDRARIAVPRFIRILLGERASQLRPPLVLTPSRPAAPEPAPEPASSDDRSGTRRVAANGGIVTIGPDKVDPPNDPVDRLLHDMRALLTAHRVRAEPPEVASLKAELALANDALLRAEREFREALKAKDEQFTNQLLRDRQRADAEIARLRDEVSRLEADNLRLVEEGVALLKATTADGTLPVEQRSPPSPGAVAAALMRQQREAEQAEAAKREREAQAAAKAESRKAMQDALRPPPPVPGPAPEPAPEPAPPKNGAAPTVRRKVHHPLVRALATIVADLKAHAAKPEDVPPVLVTTRADKAWRALDIADREAIVAGLRAWMNGSTARLAKVPHTHKISKVLEAPYHLLCARNWRVVMDRTAQGWELYDLVHRSDRAVYSSEH